MVKERPVVVEDDEGLELLDEGIEVVFVEAEDLGQARDRKRLLEGEEKGEEALGFPFEPILPEGGSKGLGEDGVHAAPEGIDVETPASRELEESLDEEEVPLGQGDDLLELIGRDRDLQLLREEVDVAFHVAFLREEVVALGE